MSALLEQHRRALVRAVQYLLPQLSSPRWSSVERCSGVAGGSVCVHHRALSTKVDPEEFEAAHVRNFSIIAHVDHGKSTLADRLLELTQTVAKIDKAQGNQQYLDKLQVERERGITVKAQTASLLYTYDASAHNERSGRISNDSSAGAGIAAQRYLLNLIDTPGHVDFSYEVSRSLAACQGALLVVDAAQGVQAQTVANFFSAFELGLEVVPIINKVDLPSADVPAVRRQLRDHFDLPPEEALLVSARTGLGLEQVLPAVIERIPAPAGVVHKPLRMLLFDCYYDNFRGAVCLVAVVDGSVRKGDKIQAASSGKAYEALEVGVLHPELEPTGLLRTGQVGYIICGMRTTREARVGDTLHCARTPQATIEVLPGFRPARPMVYAGLYPANPGDYDALADAMNKLTLNDASVSVSKENSVTLGGGFRVGFLGLLHMDVMKQRLQQEHNASVIVTAPTVPYQVQTSDGKWSTISSAAELPSADKMQRGMTVKHFREPMVVGTIVTPEQYVGPLMQLCAERFGEPLEHTMLGAIGSSSNSLSSGTSSAEQKQQQRVLLKYRLPMREVIVGFFGELKARSSGYASFDYEEDGYADADICKVDILVNGERVDTLAFMTHSSKAQLEGRAMITKLKGLIRRQLFEVVLQAAVGSRVIARETIAAMRKNVLAKCYGGDVSRKKKLLEKQKEGKRRMRSIGNVEIPQQAFMGLLNTEK